MPLDPPDCPVCGELIRNTHTCRGPRHGRLRPPPAGWRQRVARALAGDTEPDARPLPLDVPE